MTGMVVFVASPPLGNRNGQSETDQTRRLTTKGSPTHRPPTRPSHTTRSQEEKEKRSCFPNLPRPCDRRKLVPCPLPVRLPPALSTGKFPISFPSSKGQSPTTGCSDLGKTWLLMTRLAAGEVCPVTWQPVPAGTGLFQCYLMQQRCRPAACEALRRMCVRRINGSEVLGNLLYIARRTSYLKAKNRFSIIRDPRPGQVGAPGNQWGSSMIFPVSSLLPESNTRQASTESKNSAEHLGPTSQPEVWQDFSGPRSQKLNGSDRSPCHDKGRGVDALGCLPGGHHQKPTFTPPKGGIKSLPRLPAMELKRVNPSGLNFGLPQSPVDATGRLSEPRGTRLRLGGTVLASTCHDLLSSPPSALSHTPQDQTASPACDRMLCLGGERGRRTESKAGAERALG